MFWVWGKKLMLKKVICFFGPLLKKNSRFQAGMRMRPSMENEILSKAISSEEFSRSGLKCSIENEVFKREWYFLGPAFGRMDFSRIFIFEPPDFFADFLAGFFLLIFVGKSAQKIPPGKSPGKSSKIYTTKILQHHI